MALSTCSAGRDDQPSVSAVFVARLTAALNGPWSATMSDTRKRAGQSARRGRPRPIRSQIDRGGASLQSPAVSILQARVRVG